MYNFLPNVLAIITGVPRYRPTIQWNEFVTSNMFRVFEQIFGRRIGVRPSITQTIGYEQNVVYLHSYEAIVVYAEIIIRNWFSGLIKDLSSIRIYTPQMAISGMPMPSSPYHFAIAFDQTTGSLGTVGPGTAVDNTVTLTGSNVAIFVGWVGNNSGSEECTGVTYAGSALTKAGYLAQSNPNASADRARYGYYRLSCSTGANTLRVSYSSSHFVFGMCASYTGVDGSGSVDIQSSTLGGSVASITLTFTVPTANSWLVTIASVSGYVSQSASTGAFARGTTDPSTQNIYDSNGTVGSGSQSIVVAGSSPSGDNNMNIIGVSFPPYVAATVTEYASRMLRMFQ